MLSYRHAFHAGNHADILKHAALSQILLYLEQKDKPFTYIDTHAGAGRYDLTDERAEKTGETKEGIGRLYDRTNVPDFFIPYIELCKRERDLHGIYPGSPEIARQLCRENDSIVLMELHPTEIDNLRTNMGGDKRIHIHHRDGFAGLAALCPPEPKRGLALIDPSYELAEDYIKAANTLVETHRRWPVGTLVLWYPVVERRKGELMALKDRLQVSGIREIMTAELLVDESNEEGFGLAGSGLLMVQPPWGIAERLAEALPWLAEALGKNGVGTAKIEWLAED
jgi:23S rRNA (adenine2030-N6)-methyltransferase